MSEWTIKLALAAAVTAACTMAGRALCQKELRRVAILQGLLGAIPPLRIAMLERMSALEGALRETGNALFVHVAGNIADGMSAREAWRLCRPELSAQGAMLDCLMPEDMQRLDILFESLGGSGVSEQQILLGASEEGLAALLSGAKARATERGRLYSNLGLLLGLAISICLL